MHQFCVGILTFCKELSASLSCPFSSNVCLLAPLLPVQLSSFELYPVARVHLQTSVDQLFHLISFKVCFGTNCLWINHLVQ